MFETPSSRRDFMKKTAYVAPLILTLNVSLAQAQAGSRQVDPPPNSLFNSSQGSSRIGKLQSHGHGNAFGWGHQDDHRGDDRDDD
jgi:hypothetical protein